MSEPQETKKPNRFRITSIIIAIVMLAGTFGILISPFTVNVSAAPDTHTWDGGGANALASTKENWVGDVAAPEAGDTVVFNSGALPCTWDLTITLNDWSMSATYTGVVTQDVNFGVDDFTVSTGTFTGSTSYILTASGDVSIAAGTAGGLTQRLTMTGEGKTYSSTMLIDTGWFYDFRVSGNITMAGIINLVHSLTVDSGKTLTIQSPSGCVEFWMYSPGYSFSNSGTIAGNGNFIIRLHGDSPTVTFGVINSPVMIWAAAAANRTCSLGSNTVFGSTLQVFSLSTFNVTLSHGSNYQLTVAGAVTLGAIGVMIQGNEAWSFGSYTQNGASSIFKQNGNVTSNGLTVSNGLLIGNTNYVWTASGTVSIANNTLMGDTLRLTMIGEGTTYSTTIPQVSEWIYDFRASANISTSGFLNIDHNFTVDSGKTVTVSSGGIKIFYYYANSSFYNQGTITGAGSMSFELYNTNHNIIFGIINAAVYMGRTSGASDVTFTLGANAILGSTFLLHGSFPPQTGLCTFTSTLGNYTLNITGLTQIYNNAVMTQGSGVFNFAGGIAQIGVGTVFNQGGPLIITGDVSVTNGVFNADGHAVTCSGTWDFVNSTFSQSFLTTSAHLSFYSPQTISITTLPVYSSSTLSWSLASLDTDANVTFTLSGLESGRMYRLYVDGVASSLLTATGGTISFTYSGPWSEHQFEIVATSITGSISPLVNLIFIMFAIGVVVGVIAEGTNSLRKMQMRTTEQMVKSLLNMVIYIVIGIASLGVLYSIVV